MNTFLACTRAEAYKLNQRAKYHIFFALLMLAYALMRIFPGLSNADYMPVLFSALGGASGMALGSFLLKVYLPLIAFMGACDLFANEIKQKSVRACVMMPAGRVTICFAKCAAVFITGAAQALAFTLFDTLLGLIPGLNALGEPIQLVMLLVDLIPFACMVAFAAVINLIIRAPGFTMLVCIVSYIALITVGFIYGISSCLFTGYLAWHTLLVGYTLPFKALMPRILCVLGSLSAFAALDALLFERMEL